MSSRILGLTCFSQPSDSSISIPRFFPLFDTSRSALAPLYSDISTFSLSINTSIAPRARAAGLQAILPNQKSLTWKPYTSVSRNLLRMSKLADRVSRLHVGTEAIMKIFNGRSSELGVPVTKHPLEKGDKWSMDSFAVEREVGGPVLLVNVHGEFEESECQKHCRYLLGLSTSCTDSVLLFQCL